MEYICLKAAVVPLAAFIAASIAAFVIATVTALCA